MQVILLERVPNLGQMGDVVRVKDGYARNFLLPRHKALRATKDNIAHSKHNAHSLKHAISLRKKKLLPLLKNLMVNLS